MSDSFCNPYHFVPVTRENPSSEQSLKVTDFDERKLKNYGHAKYHPDTLSGRIICKLTTEKEIFIGAAQTRPNPKEVATAEHFELEGKPAIPASSLRGLLSSLVESASHSALRVLDDRVLSVRQEMKKSVHRFFKQINPELLPFNDKRNLITPAELLFGFVQKDTHSSNDKGRALAGRVNVSFGILNPEQSTSYYQDKVVLKSLLSPKPPCPIMYFKEPEQGKECITKRTLDPSKHVPQGRKMYLHAHQDNGEQPWKTVDSEKNKSLKTKIRPLKPETVFYFHLDFHNLNRWELGLLYYALRPTNEFRHKLGMGKAIGLGTVRIDPIGLFLIDREKRYRSDDIFLNPRYHQVAVDDAIPENLYPQEHAASNVEQNAPKWQELRDKFAKTMLLDVKNALELLGDPSKVPAKVMVPTTNINKPEDENFKWFEENNGEQQLLPLNEKSCKIPTLKALKHLK